MIAQIQVLAASGPVFLPLFCCSLVALAVIIERSLVMRGLSVESDAKSVGRLVSVGDDAAALDAAGALRGPVSDVIRAAIGERNSGTDALRLSAESAAFAAGARMARPLAALDTIVTLAPLMGLFGTVTGMIRAFHVIGMLGSEDPRAITGGIAESLIATSLGLGIAICALVFYNYLARKCERIAAAAEATSRMMVAAYARRLGAPRPVRIGREPGAQIKRARIEIIPMIDTIFFLLVFFMMSVLTMVHAPPHRVELPVSTTADIKPNEMVVVTATRDGNFYVDDQPAARSQITGMVAADLSSHPARIAVVNCDRNVPIAVFLQLYDRTKRASPAQILIATKPITGGSH